MSKKTNEEIAIRVENLSKTFKIPHEKHTSLKSAALSLFKKKSYTEFKALDDVCFEIKKGEFFGVIGRNGSGKSTLLKMLAKIYVPDSGKIIINGKVSPFLELGVGFNPELTGRENLYLGGSILGLSREEIDKKFDKIVEFSELKDFIDMKLKNYSSGMQVRLAFSLAINVHAEILLMDEVLAVGDSNFQTKCLNEFNKYRKEGKTVVLVTHSIETIQKYCDRALLLRRGNIQAIGDSKKIADLYFKQNFDDINRDTENNVFINKSKRRNIKIKEIAFLDSDNQKKNTFTSGQDMKIRVYLQNTKNLEDFNFGISIFTQEDQYILDTNTELEKVNTKSVLKKGYFDLVLTKLFLNSGTYYAKIGLSSKDNLEIFDFCNNTQPFRVVNRVSRNGIIASGDFRIE